MLQTKHFFGLILIRVFFSPLGASCNIQKASEEITVRIDEGLVDLNVYKELEQSFLPRSWPAGPIQKEVKQYVWQSTSHKETSAAACLNELKNPHGRFLALGWIQVFNNSGKLKAKLASTTTQGEGNKIEFIPLWELGINLSCHQCGCTWALEQCHLAEGVEHKGLLKKQNII